MLLNLTSELFHIDPLSVKNKKSFKELQAAVILMARMKFYKKLQLQVNRK